MVLIKLIGAIIRVIARVIRRVIRRVIIRMWRWSLLIIIRGRIGIRIIKKLTLTLELKCWLITDIAILILVWIKLGIVC